MKLLQRFLVWIWELAEELLEQRIIFTIVMAAYVYWSADPEDKSSDVVGGVFIILAVYALFNKELRIWRVFRAFGISIFVFNFIGYRSDNQNDNIHLSWMIFSLLAIIGGEIALYLHKLTEFMICPRCVGKGFVDKNDITRLGMEGSWSQGYCRYCDGKGKVDVGKTKRINPRSFIGPSSHESDTPGN